MACENPLARGAVDGPVTVATGDKRDALSIYNGGLSFCTRAESIRALSPKLSSHDVGVVLLDRVEH